MQPLINLKQFIAVLLLLSIPAALLVAYFRNYDPQAEGHQHSESATHGTNRMTGEVENKPYQNRSLPSLTHCASKLKPAGCNLKRAACSLRLAAKL